MIKQIYGNLLEQEYNIIAHQVNCKGVKGGGLALQIKKKYYNVYKEYFYLCHNAKKSSDLLGSIQPIKTNKQQYIVNVFGQDDFGKNKKQTDYNALNLALSKLHAFMKEKQLNTIGFPYKFGSGLAGGDWNVVFNMIKKEFDDDKNIICYIVQY